MLIDRLSRRMSNNSTNETFDLSYDEGDDAQMTHRVNNNDNKSLVDEGQLTEISDHLHPLIHLSSRDLSYLWGILIPPRPFGYHNIAVGVICYLSIDLTKRTLEE
jgi:hypothetical protein